MKRFSGASACVIAIVCAGSQVRAAGSDPRLEVSIHVRATVTGPEMFAARTVAAKLYAAAGVRIIWHEQDAPDAPVRRPTVVLVSSSREIDAAMGSRRTLGRVVQPRVRAYVHYDRVVQMARDFHLDRGMLLGQVIAHEIGHLLLGAAHTVDGVMAPTIDRRQIPVVTFSRDQADALRATLSRLR
jgi:hypothetical protein